MRKLVVLAALAALAVPAESSTAPYCPPTPADSLGPFYEPGAPVRSRVGRGYVLTGRVLSTGCRPLVRARIEFWLANPNGDYDDAHRATLFSARNGAYRFESNKPPPYSSRPAHIHVRVSARGHRTLVTQHYPRSGRTSAVFNLVLRRAG